MKDEILKKYHGLTVEWKTTLFNAQPASENKELVELTLDIKEDESLTELAKCTVSLTDYRQLGIANKGTPIKVIGEIENVGLVFNLKNVILYFETFP
jgi:hypothetical protein